MTLLQKMGQLFIFGFKGTTPSKGIIDLISKANIGGIILFSRNLKDPLQSASLTNALQSHSKRMPLLVSIDQEGGRVSRLPKGFTCFPSATVFGALGKTELAYKAAEITARELRAVGINMNFAPVLDVLTRAENPVIGDRAFSSSPTAVSMMGLAVMAGLQDNGVIACGKHFPGHGDTTADSHLTLPKVNRPVNRLQSVELRPFIHLMENGLAVIMTAHVLYPAWDRSHPATLSQRIIGRLLRHDLGFQRVVVTDDLEMEAISQDPGEAAVQALLGGVDLLLICHEEEKQRAALEAVYKAVEEGRISESRIDQSLLRVLTLKEQFLLPYTPTDSKTVRTIVGQSSHRHTLDEMVMMKIRHKVRPS